MPFVFLSHVFFIPRKLPRCVSEVNEGHSSSLAKAQWHQHMPLLTSLGGQGHFYPKKMTFFDSVQHYDSLHKDCLSSFVCSDIKKGNSLDSIVGGRSEIMWECERFKSLNQSVQQLAFRHDACSSMPVHLFHFLYCMKGLCLDLKITGRTWRRHDRFLFACQSKLQLSSQHAFYC